MYNKAKLRTALDEWIRLYFNALPSSLITIRYKPINSLIKYSRNDSIINCFTVLFSAKKYQMPEIMSNSKLAERKIPNMFEYKDFRSFFVLKAL